MAVAYDGLDDRGMTESIAGIPIVWPMTFAAVVRAENQSGNNPLLNIGFNSAAQGIRMQINNSRALRLAAATGFTSTVIAPLQEWAFLAITILDNTNKRFFAYSYQTRTEQTQFVATSVAPGPVNSAKLKIGCGSIDDSVFAAFYSGVIGWLAIWDRYLGDVGDGYDQLRTLAQIGPLAMGKTAYFADFCEGQGLLVKDRSGNGNHATLYNGPKWQPWQASDGPSPCEPTYSYGSVSYRGTWGGRGIAQERRY